MEPTPSLFTKKEHAIGEFIAEVLRNLDKLEYDSQLSVAEVRDMCEVLVRLLLTKVEIEERVSCSKALLAKARVGAGTQRGN